MPAEPVEGRDGSAVPALSLDLAHAEDECGDNALSRVRRALEGLPRGALLEVTSPVAEHAFAVRAWSRREGVGVVADERHDGVARILLRRG